MIPMVHSLKEAREWFLRNSAGQLKCVDGDREQVVDCYPEAEEFYAE